MDKAQEQKQQALDAALSHIEKSFGKGAIMRLGDNYTADLDVVPTGALPLDLALGVGGLPKGRIVEIYGPESSGKTTLVYHIIAEAQKTCSSLSPTMANRHSRSANCSSAAARSMS